MPFVTHLLQSIFPSPLPSPHPVTLPLPSGFLVDPQGRTRELRQVDGLISMATHPLQGAEQRRDEPELIQASRFRCFFKPRKKKVAGRGSS